MPSKRRPEDMIAADLGLSLGDLERIVRHDRAKRLAGRMESVVRRADRMVRGELMGHEISAMTHDAREIIEALDRPISERRAG